VHGHVTGRGYTSPDRSVNPRRFDNMAPKESLEPSEEKEKDGRAIDVTILP